MQLKKFIEKYGIYLLILIAVTAVFFYYGHAKAGYYIDEVYTYGLSNSHNAPYLKDVAGGDLIDKIITRDDLISYVTVDEGEELDFSSVYTNQEADVHPPLYYWLFNLVSGIAGEKFSKWTGLLLDYIIYLGVLALLAVICNEMFDNRFTTYSALILYGVSIAGISTAVYIRMYCLLTFLTLALVHFSVLLMRKKKLKYCIFVGLTIFAGMMTQYYFVFYAFFICCALLVYFIAKKEYVIMWKFAACAVAGVALMVLLFPASIKHVFVGNGQVVSGGVAVDNFFNFVAWPERIIKYAHFVTHGLKAAVIVGAIAFIYLLLTRRLEFSPEIAVIVIPAVVTWLLIALMSAVKEERYIYNIMPVFIIFVAWLLNHMHIHYAALVCIAALALNNTGCNVDYIQPTALDKNEILAPYSGSPCVYLTDNKFAAMTSDYYELLNFENFFSTDNTQSKDMLKYIGDADKVVVYIDSNDEWSSGFNPEEKIKEMQVSTGFNKSEKVIDNSLSVVYVLS